MPYLAPHYGEHQLVGNARANYSNYLGGSVLTPKTVLPMRLEDSPAYSGLPIPHKIRRHPD
ncbi:unnamed protein product [Haemonchus placei]|uniref:Uncharacterized protein n=1 Tax=Haemonchus placei TaxID=6290 RepID=A0A0N4VZH2_HAEPC|nr:unnamed protein product [Haemonchus placei]